MSHKNVGIGVILAFAAGVCSGASAAVAGGWHKEYSDTCKGINLEKARAFDPFGHAGFDASGKIRMTP